jgi:hypothetical protein
VVFHKVGVLRPTLYFTLSSLVVVVGQHLVLQVMYSGLANSENFDAGHFFLLDAEFGLPTTFEAGSVIEIYIDGCYGN